MSPVEDLASTEDVLTVADLNRRIGDVVSAAEPLQDVRCLGEISDLSRYDWGMFIDLVYDDHDLTAVMWDSRVRELDVDLEPGMEVLVTGSVEVYAEAGRLNLRPWEITVLGEGDRALQREQLRAELEARGWFADTHNQELPAFPTRVGVVTSLDGDARYDIEESIHSRDPSTEIVIQDARVQGEHAAESLANAIHTLDRDGDVDVIVVGRGGGSETDLQAFDTEAVAEAVFTAGTPVVAAVGHREDEPLVEEVADATAITPTEAGVTVVPDREQVDEHLADLTADLDRAYETTVSQRLETLERRLEDAYTDQVRERLRALDRRLTDAYAATERRAAEQAATQRYRRAVVVLAALVVALVLVLVGVVVL